MHDIHLIRQDPTAFDQMLGRRNLSVEDRQRFSAVNITSVDERRRAIIRVREQTLARRNAISKEIGQAKAQKDDARFGALMAQAEADKHSIAAMDAEQKKVEKELNDLLAEIPNLPLPDVPEGKDEHGNIEHHRFGAKRDRAFAPKQHFELGEALGQMDFETAAKLSGARFVVLKKGLARLERALGQFFLDVHISEPHNYTEIMPPILVRNDVMFGTAQLPKFEDDQFAVYRQVTIREREERVRENERRKNYESQGGMAAVIANRFQALGPAAEALVSDPESQPSKDYYWLIPTAEVPLTNLVRESILDETQLPLRYTACTPCFRAEAGAAGKDTRGMIRQHQFTKVELVSITTPEQSKNEHERMLACAEEVLKRLDLHYRVMTLCTGDMGFASQKTYDIEVWLPGQNMYREISSCSICGEFQARRMNARYRTKEGRNVRHVHTLNGSGVAVGRALIAVMENYQQENGSIAVPEALAPYMGGLKTIAKGE
jgi:seryl-tRNA synthetase